MFVNLNGRTDKTARHDRHVTINIIIIITRVYALARIPHHDSLAWTIVRPDQLAIVRIADAFQCTSGQKLHDHHQQTDAGAATADAKHVNDAGLYICVQLVWMYIVDEYCSRFVDGLGTLDNKSVSVRAQNIAQHRRGRRHDGNRWRRFDRWATLSREINAFMCALDTRRFDDEAGHPAARPNPRRGGLRVV